MNAPSDLPAGPTATATAGADAASIELIRSVLAPLGDELGRRLLELRAGLDLRLTDPAAPLPAEQAGHVETMAMLCDELLATAGGYLDELGLAPGGRALRLGTFTIGAIAAEIDRQHRAAAAERGRAWSCGLSTPAEAAATVTTDAERIRRLVAPLVANALRHSPPGGRVAVDLAVEGRHWRIAVADQGPGVPAEAADRVFEPFYRLPRDDRPDTPGHGLGLALARELAGQLGGTMAMSQADGAGARVVARLPIEGPAGRPRA